MASKGVASKLPHLEDQQLRIWPGLVGGLVWSGSVLSDDGVWAGLVVMICGLVMIWSGLVCCGVVLARFRRSWSEVV